MARSKLGPIPDDHHENDPLPTTGKEKPLSADMQAWLERMKQFQKEPKGG
jgi:hypothetical protein